MHIDEIICPDAIEEKLIVKHRLSVHEAEDALLHARRVRFAERGYTPGEDVYAAFGQTTGGRYVVVFFVYKPSAATAIIISARDMTDKERTTVMAENNPSSRSNATTLEDMGAFWETHDFTEHDPGEPDVTLRSH